MIAACVLIGALAAATAEAAPPAETLPDPTRPYQYSEAVNVAAMPAAPEAGEWRLSGIQVRDGLKRAILNGKLVKEGEQIDGATVTAIGTGDLTLTVNQKQFVVHLLIPEIKQSVAANRRAERTEAK